MVRLAYYTLTTSAQSLEGWLKILLTTHTGAAPKPIPLKLLLGVKLLKKENKV
jgi:hypothetical protein